MKKYRITWKQVTYGESFAEANSEDEARKLAEQGKDTDWDDFDEYSEWIISEIEEIERGEYFLMQRQLK